MAKPEIDENALLTARQLAETPGLPVKRCEKTWFRYMANGVRINGVVRKIPTVEIATRLHTSIAAVRKVFAKQRKPRHRDTEE